MPIPVLVLDSPDTFLDLAALVQNLCSGPSSLVLESPVPVLDPPFRVIDSRVPVLGPPILVHTFPLLSWAGVVLDRPPRGFHTSVVQWRFRPEECADGPLLLRCSMVTATFLGATERLRWNAISTY